MSRLGFIGTGTIGAPIAARLLAAGHTLTIHDRSTDAMRPLMNAGARGAEHVTALADVSDTVFLSLPGPAQIEAVVRGDGGLLAAAAPPATIVDLSTNDVTLNRELATDCAKRGVHFLDAPVSGGRVAAEKGTLTVMVGGDPDAFEAVGPLLGAFGKHVHYMGPAGAGTLTKLVNNQLFLAVSVLVQEAFVTGAAAGMAPGALLEVLKTSSAGPFVAQAGLMLSHRFDLGVFALAIAEKDLALALDAAKANGVAAPVSAAALETYRAALADGLGAADFFATLDVIERRAGVTLPKLPKP